jgi:hypothetical protein
MPVAGSGDIGFGHWREQATPTLLPTKISLRHVRASSPRQALSTDERESLGDLLDDRELFGGSARPNGASYLVHVIADRSDQHALPPEYSLRALIVVNGGRCSKQWRGQ